MPSRQSAAPRPSSPRRPGTFRIPFRIAAIPPTLAGGLLLLTEADGSGNYFSNGALPATLVGIAFLLSLVCLTITSMSPKPRFALQLLCIYYVVFFLLPGFHHMTTNTFPFFNLHYALDVRVRSGVIVLLFFISVIFAYALTTSRMGYDPIEIGERIVIRPNVVLIGFLVLLSIVCLGIMVSFIGLDGMLSTRGDGSGVMNDSLALTGLSVTLSRCITFITIVYLLMVLRFADQKLYTLVVFIFMTPIFLLTNWPLSLPRFALFGDILCILVVVWDTKSIKYRIGMSLAFVLGALVIMPVANALTRGKETISTINYQDQFGKYFDAADYDGLQSINNAVMAVDREGFRAGRQILSAIFFFVPRSVWPGKAEQSGSIAAEAAGYKYLNVSQPIPGEIYLDFGLPGVVIGGLLIGYALCRFDKWAADNWYLTPRSRLFTGLVVAYSIIVYRGALLAVISGVFTLMVLAYLVSRFGLPPIPRRGGVRTKAIR